MIRRVKRAASQLEDSKSPIFAYYDNESTGATEFRRLARNVRHRGNPSEVKSILVTSATKHEGKSLIAANLAIAIAKREDDREVLLSPFREFYHSPHETRLGILTSSIFTWKA